MERPCHRANQSEKSINPRGTGTTRRKSGTSFILDKQIAPFGTISLGEARNFSFFANYRQGGNISQINEANKGKQVSTFAVESLKVFSK